MKRCTVCKELKALEDFNNRTVSKDGKMSVCRLCHRAKVRRQFQDPAFRELHRKHAKIFRVRHGTRLAREMVQKRNQNPIKFKAREAVQHALKYGRLTRQPCEVCGLKAHAHHEDYSKPLDVRWLCEVHHRAAHGHVDAGATERA